MHDRWTNQIDAITNDFKESLGMLTLEQLNWRPFANSWSIGQNLDHLIVINGTYYPVIKAVRSGTYQLPIIAKLDFMVSFLGRTVLKAVQPDRRKKIKTFPIWEPTTSDIKPDIWERFEKHQSELKMMIQSSSDLLDNGTVISSPANRYIVYKLETAFDIIVSHERRHFEQSMEIEEIRKAEQTNSSLHAHNKK
ncbi:MAG: DinB family protein [Cyclobacteriaceae bacterium]|nr:DinB family protein [Cyclobacteriaceae bacterium]